MRRGEVHFFPVDLPDRENIGADDVEDDHFVLTLRTSDPGTEDNVPFVVGTSAEHRHVDQRFGYEVRVPAGAGLFPKETIFDCRWVMTRPTWEFTQGTYRFDLDAVWMYEISLAIVEGLQL